MRMMNIVLVVDGPARGTVREVKGHRFTVIDTPPIQVNPPPPMDTISMNQVMYHVHKLFVFGRFIRVASVQSLAEWISEDDVFEQIASDKAKDASYRSPA
jgi:hypothetical protein